jgi:hypothetical protein
MMTLPGNVSINVVSLAALAILKLTVFGSPGHYEHVAAQKTAMTCSSSSSTIS